MTEKEASVGRWHKEFFENIHNFVKSGLTERQNEIRDVVIDKNLLNKKLNSYSYLYNVNSGIELFNKLQQTGEIKAKCY